jgi:hypothetical protein
MWSLARDPLRRPASIEDFAIELEQFGSVGFADNGRMSEHKGSMRPRKLSERAPDPAVRAPAAQQAVQAPQLAPAGAPRSKPRLWLIASAVLLLAVAAFAFLRGRVTEKAPPESAAPPAAPAASAPDPERAPALTPLPTPEGVAAPEPTLEAAPEDASKSPRAVRAPERPAPPAEAPPAEAPEAAPANAPRGKQSPGVADPWSD